MKNQNLAQRYATALFHSAQDSNVLDTVYQGLQSFQEALGHQELRMVYETPIFAAEGREQTVRDVLKKLEIDGLTQNFILLLLKKKRSSLFDGVVEQFKNRLDQDKNQQVVRVVSAEPLSEQYLEKLKGQMEEKTQKSVILETEIDASILGGVIAWVGDEVYDGSLRTRMESMRNQLLAQMG